MTKMMNVSAVAAKVLLTGLIALSAASCGKEFYLPGDDAVQVEFVVGGEAATKVTGVSSDNEQKINRWAVFVFSGSTRVAYSSSNSSAGIKLSVPAGTYDVYTMVNYPSGFSPAQASTYTAIHNLVAELSDNSASSLEMYGSVEDMEVTAGADTKVIPVKRLVARVGVKKVSVNMSKPADAAKTFVLKGIYVSNVYSRSWWGADLSESQMSATQGLWCNPLGQWNATGAAADNLGDRSINATVANGGSYSTPHYFYTFPNATSSDTHATSSWSKRHTRIVIEATLGGTTYYYQVNLPVTTRNNSYVVQDAVITKPGSLDPEDEVAGAIEVTFATDTEDWSGPVGVTETS